MFSTMWCLDTRAMCPRLAYIYCSRSCGGGTILCCGMKYKQAVLSENVIPQEVSANKLRACMVCGLVKTFNQFVVFGCENCPGLIDVRVADRERVATVTTSLFSGLVSITRPLDSWVAKWQRVARLVPGCYAIAVRAALPEDIVEELEEKGLQVPRTRATAAAYEYS